MNAKQGHELLRNRDEFFVEDQLDAFAAVLKYGAIGYGDSSRQELMADALSVLCQTMAYLVRENGLTGKRKS